MSIPEAKKTTTQHGMLERVPCLLCVKADDTEPVAVPDKDALPTYVSICPRDGLVYLTPRWTKARYQQFYEHEYYEHYRRRKPSAKTGDARYRHIRSVWDRTRAHLAEPPQAVLDVGAGMGWSLDYMRREVNPAAALAAIEPSVDYRAHLTDSLGADVLAADVDTDWQEGREGQFDFVILRHVLEHLLDPVAALKKVRRVLAPGGRVYIAVPDMMSPIRPLQGRWFEIVHTYYFSETTLKRTAALAGLRACATGFGGAEVWCVFEKAPEGYDPAFDSVYEEQMRVIRHNQRIDRTKKVAYALPRALARRLPSALARRLPDALRRRLL